MDLNIVEDMAACPFCGKVVDLEDGDTLHPSGTGWMDDAEDNIRTYHRLAQVPRAQWCWVMNCPTSAGGCGANISGDSRSEVVAKWNRRTNNN